MYRYKFRGVVKRIGINSFNNLTASFFVLYLSNRHPSTEVQVLGDWSKLRI